MDRKGVPPCSSRVLASNCWKRQSVPLPSTQRRMRSCAHTTQRTTCNGRHATDNMQQTTCNGQHARDNAQRTPDDGQHATMRHETDNVQRRAPSHEREAAAVDARQLVEARLRQALHRIHRRRDVRDELLIRLVGQVCGRADEQLPAASATAVQCSATAARTHCTVAAVGWCSNGRWATPGSRPVDHAGSKDGGLPRCCASLRLALSRAECRVTGCFGSRNVTGFSGNSQGP